MRSQSRRTLLFVTAAFATPALAGRAFAQATRVPQTSPMTLADAIRANPELSRFAEMLGTANAWERLETPNARLTVFAPNNAAFNAMPGTVMDSLRNPTGSEAAGGTSRLNSVALQHIAVFNQASGTFLNRAEELTTLNGGKVRVDGTRNPIEVRALPVAGVLGAPGVNAEGPARIVGADYVATNGTLHIIDTVLLPS
jgi:uncharacterized surface protein with fasciclin (FAS1) repeats